MTGQELERGVFVAALPPPRGQHVFLLGFEHRKAPNFRKIDRCSSGNRAPALHPSSLSVATPKTLSEPGDTELERVLSFFGTLLKMNSFG